MINGKLRPWGKPQWLFGMPSIKNEKWFLIGSLSTQDRCLSLLGHRSNSFNLAHVAFLEILDEQSKFSEKSKLRRDASRALFEAMIDSAQREVHQFSLFEPLKKLKTLIDSWVKSSHAKNVILDVSALPEKFFFPIVRWLLESAAVKNIVITYMLPEQYTHEDLAYDALDAAQLQSFTYAGSQPEPSIQSVIVGVGFLPFSLPEWLKKTYPNTKQAIVSLIFPFPSTPSNVHKCWEFVRRIETSVNLADDSQIPRVDANDLSACFDRIQTITNFGKTPTVFAPFGPKAHSVAMCLQAINMGAEVYYTQPSFYHPEYSTGIKMDGFVPAGYAYAIRLNGCDLYSL
jgi:hypothetical protein